MTSGRFLLIFLLFLAILAGAFYWLVQSASAVLPREDEILSVEEAGQLLANQAIERVLIEDDQNIYLYRPGEPRPLYVQLDPGRTFTETFEALGVPPDQFPPIHEEK